MNVPPGTDPRRPSAPAQPAGAAYNETLLAAEPARASSVLQPEGVPASDPPAGQSLSERLRALPLGIQGAWVGLLCITLLVGSAAALRSLFASAAGGAQGSPPSSGSASAAVASGSASGIGSAPLASGGSLGASPTGAPSGTAMAIGGGASLGGPGAGGTGLPGFGALSIRDRLSSHVRLRKYGAFVDDLERLLDVEPDAIHRPDLRKMITDVAVSATLPGLGGVIPPESERLFAFLTGRAGTAGPDILFDLVTTKGGTRAASLAEDLLKQKDVLAKGTPALQIAWEIRSAPSCEARVALFDRAKTDGDRRVLVALFPTTKCGKGPSDCCLSNDPGYKEVLRVITAKK